MTQTQAASQPAEQEDVFRGEQISFDEFSRYRKAGELPERFKPAEEAKTDAPEETVESEGDEPKPEPEPEQEEEAQEPPQKPQSPAQKRILQLLAEKKELQRKLEAFQPPAKPEPAPQQQFTRSKPAVDAKDDKGAPKYATYEEYVEDLADWKAEQQVARYKREQQEQEALRELKSKLDDARSRYEDADDVIFPAAAAIRDAQMPMAVKEVFAQSDLFPDLCYVVGSDPDELKKFVSLAQSNPRAALARVFEYERGIREELGKAEDGGKAPETRKTSAPKPPTPVTGGSSRAFDVSDESLSPEEWARKRTADIERRRKGPGRS